MNIHPLIEKDIAVISDAFNKIGWNKPLSLFEGYLKEQEAGDRLVWVGFANIHGCRPLTAKATNQQHPVLDDGLVLWFVKSLS